ncbi:TetR family transcriptional regulator [Phytoactinopolyspora endophytica]|uniref:acyl-CoA-like ligand-binding transcription factor n=1 Tax=Phytoactinopolyspora endophytica TaxID=1642495 RepID=UPI00101BF8A5|nr:TetR family transcriptional regulator [Phytoactinopolyspora endophytica]
MSSHENGQPTGLRERKKARTRTAIQDHALRLYMEQGYVATTVEQIADAADVSQSTFFRYFPTKADTVFYDRYDPLMMETFVRQPADLSPVAAVRASIHDVLQHMNPDELALEKTRWRLIAEVQELQSVLTDSVRQNNEVLCHFIAARVGREPDDFAVRIWVGAVLGAVYAAYFAAMASPDSDFIEYFDAALAQLEAGLPL